MARSGSNGPVPLCLELLKLRSSSSIHEQQSTGPITYSTYQLLQAS